MRPAEWVTIERLGMTVTMRDIERYRALYGEPPAFRSATDAEAKAAIQADHDAEAFDRMLV